LIIIIVFTNASPIRVSATPGSATIGGQILFQPRNWNGSNWHLAEEVEVKLFENSCTGIERNLGTAYTNTSGYFQFQPISYSCGSPNIPFYVYLKVYTEYLDGSMVTNQNSDPHYFTSGATQIYGDGNWTIDYQITNSLSNSPAMWLFEDVRKSWNFVHSNDIRNGIPFDPGKVQVVWEPGLRCNPYTFLSIPQICTPFTYAGPFMSPFIFISSDYTNSMDNVVHETGHMFMVNASN
jgi:hypothetical protein